MIRVLIAEDQAMVRGALASLLALEDDIEVVGQIERGDEVLAAARASEPDVALLDIEMPGRDGIAAAGELARELAAAIRTVNAGGRAIDPALAVATITEGESPLTAREHDVLHAAMRHDTTADIAASLHLSEGTVRNYLSAAIQKLGARNRREAIAHAVEKGWL